VLQKNLLEEAAACARLNLKLMAAAVSSKAAPTNPTAMCARAFQLFTTYLNAVEAYHVPDFTSGESSEATKLALETALNARKTIGIMLVSTVAGKPKSRFGSL